MVVAADLVLQTALRVRAAQVVVVRLPTVVWQAQSTLVVVVAAAVAQVAEQVVAA